MKDAQEWSLYWAQGHINSFGDTSKQNYEGVLKENWINYFKTIENSNTVLDLCTGNASLLRLAADEIPTFSKIKFIGIDYAAIDQTDKFFEHKNIKLISNQNVEKLEFLDNSINFICSSFGVEYSDIKKTTKEVLRVLSSGGIAQYICHDKASKLIKDNADRVLFLDALLVSNGALDTLENLAMLMEKQTKNEQSEAFRNRLNKQLSSLLELNKILLLESQILDFLKVVLNPKTINKVIEVKKYREEMQSYLNRLRFMVDAGLSEKDVNELLEIISTNKGRIVENRQLTENNEILCRKLCFIKN